MAPIPASILLEIIGHVESGYPHECCGVVLTRGEGWRVRPMRNAYDQYHAIDPSRFPRTSRTAYLFDPKEWLAVSSQADDRGEKIACVYHSHIDAGAYFSAEDRAMAAPDGEPLLPSTAYLVLAVDDGKTTAAKIYSWEQGDFGEATAQLPARNL
jgi:proteasome lid subunit RPN8/RPN11